jgi:NAD(P)-dependent dehydrogenase (short-subunit alcohol dehydrogenase family)
VNRVALVTGASRGIGRGIALALAAAGHDLVVNYAANAEAAAEVVATAEQHGVAALAVPADVSLATDRDRLVCAAYEKFGRIDLLVNNAGGQYMTPAEDINPKGFRTVMRLNVEGTWLMTHAVATRAMMPDARGGKIVNVTLSPHHGLPGMAHSSAARAAVENLTRVLSIEWARFNVRINAIAAGHFATEALTKYPKPVFEGVARTVPLQRLGEPEEHAWLVAYLASPAGDYCSGAIFTVDGARDNWLGPYPPAGLADESGKPLAEERRPRP